LFVVYVIEKAKINNPLVLCCLDHVRCLPKSRNVRFDHRWNKKTHIAFSAMAYTVD